MRALDAVCAEYIDFIKSSSCLIRQKAKLIRDLYRLSKKYSLPLFTQCLKRGVEYKIDNISSLTRIAEQLALSSRFKNEEKEAPQIPPALDNYESRPLYKQGEFSKEADLKLYGDLMKGEEDNG